MLWKSPKWQPKPQEYVRYDDFRDRLLTDGDWMPWCYKPPYGHKAVEAYRPEWDHPQTLVLANLDPAFNVANLYWREIPGA